MRKPDLQRMRKKPMRDGPAIDVLIDDREVDVDLGRMFSSVWRNKLRLLVISLLVTVAALFILQGMTEHYRAETRILIRPSNSVLSTRDSLPANSSDRLDDKGIASQVQLLLSRSIAMTVIRELELDKQPEFDSLLNPSKIDSLLAAFGLSDGHRGVTTEDRVLEAYYDKLTVFQAERSRVIVVQFSSQNPQLAAAVPNLIADEYLKLQEELKRGARPDELKRLEPELKELREGVLKAEEAVADYRNTTDLLKSDNNTSLATQELSELASELVRVRSQLSRVEASADNVSKALKNGTLDSVSSVLQSALIQRLRERQVTLEAQLADLSTTLLDGHPRMQSTRSQIAGIKKQIAVEAQKIEQSLRQEAEVARKREADLISQRNVLKSEAARVGKEEVKLNALEREAEAQRDLLKQYLVRFKEAKARQSSGFVPADAFIFARAQVPSKPYFPNKLPTLMGSFFGTLILSSMTIIAAAVLKGPPVVPQPVASAQPAALSREENTADAERVESQRAERPEMAMDENRDWDRGRSVQQGRQGDRQGAGYDDGYGDEGFFAQRMPHPAKQPESSTLHPVSADKPVPADLRNQVNAVQAPPMAPEYGATAGQSGQKQAREFHTPLRSVDQLLATGSVTAKSLSMLGASRVAVISAEEDRCSQGSVVLARLLAAEGHKVVLVDMTGKAVSSKHTLSRVDAVGIRDVLAGAASVTDAIHCDWGSAAHIMPAGVCAPQLASKNSGSLAIVLNALQKNYRYVIVDCGPVNSQGLLKVSDENTFNVVYTAEPKGDAAGKITRELQETGIGAPLVLHLTEQERSLLETPAA